MAHNLDATEKLVDWIIDLGPEGGVAYGHIVAEERPEQVAKVVASHTGQFLAGSLMPVLTTMVPDTFVSPVTRDKSSELFCFTISCQSY